MPGSFPGGLSREPISGLSPHSLKLNSLRVKTPDEEIRQQRFRQLGREAEVGWLPAVDEREEINSDVLVKCLGIAPEQTWPARMSAEQRLALVSFWFQGRESEIPYEAWGLERPAWIPEA